MEDKTLRNHLRSSLLSFQFDWDSQVWDTFLYQYRTNEVYRRFCDLLNRTPSTISSIKNIPYLPISTFKNHKVVSGNLEIQQTFRSSGTTLSNRSQHYVADIDLYNTVSQHLFETVYGPINQYCVLALLPSYLEQGHSSLIHMVNHFISLSNCSGSGFFKYNFQDLALTVDRMHSSGYKILVIGVSYALLDFASTLDLDWSDDVVVMETGGMKGRKKEMLRNELHRELKDNLCLDQVHSEYGMTELLSQLYAPKDGLFKNGTTIRMTPYEINDPLSPELQDQAGRNCVTDLANIDSCSFIATDDLIKTTKNGGFDIIGRLDHSDIRGCNLLYV
ncbi:LuxE/PaaK family acyltransferase [Membranihabitans marinus]|uniref:LuxE/PaaK family acyltransferase n=1 Tax=Membranihabitans marinus TaxID=1227546 RepID=UPI001F482676|nr:acyl transferase [Membranihabitans marinus]